MTKLYKKSEAGFFFLCLFLYLLAQNTGSFLACKIGTVYSGTAVFNLLLTCLLLRWLYRQGLTGCYRLCRCKTAGKAVLYFIPLAVISSFNLWAGACPRFSAAETFFFIISMACAAFLEELLARGLLFCLLEKKSTAAAVILSSAGFGAVHLLNLFSESNVSPVFIFVQAFSAALIGLLYAALLLRCGSLWPCIISHAAINILWGFSCQNISPVQLLSLHSIHLLLILFYTAYLFVPLHKKQ